MGASTAMKQVCILIVDDDTEDQQILREAFDMLPSPRGVIHFVDNGEMAVQFLAMCADDSELPRLIVLDLNMPKLSGVDTLRMIKSDEALKHIPVIIFSSSFNPSDAEAAKAEGAIDYITKPNTFSQFKEIVEKFSSYCSDYSLA